MYKKIFFVLSVFLLVAAGTPVKAALVAHYPFEGNYNDITTSPANGTQVGNPTFDAGYTGQAIKLNGTSQYVDCGNPTKLQISGTGVEMTIMCWAKTDGTWGPSNATLVSKGTNSYRLNRNGTNNYMYFGITNQTNTSNNSGVNINDGAWHHIAAVRSNTQRIIYIDGVLDATSTSTTAIGSNSNSVWIGNNSNSTARYWKGWIDEVKIYNNALTQEDIIASMGPFPWAKAIYPANGQLEVPINSILSWKTGGYAAAHNVYLSTNRDDVNAANPSVLVGAYQSGTTYDPGILPNNTTYYWRVDEVSSPGTPGSYTYNGTVWSFSTDLTGYPIGYADSPIGVDRITVTASSSLDAGHNQDKTKGLNNAGLAQGPGAYRAYYVDANHGTVGSGNMWLTYPTDPNGKYIQYIFDREYKLNNILVWNYNETTSKAEFGILLSQFGIKDANQTTTTDFGTSWSSPAQIQLQKGTELPAYQAIDPINGNNVDMAGAIVTGVKLQAISNWSGGLYTSYGLSEVMFLVAPTYATRHTVTYVVAATGITSTVNTSTGTVDPNVPTNRLNWNKGRDGSVSASSHKLYIKDVDNDAITNATPADPNSARNAVRDNTIAANTTTDPNYPLSGLNMQATYYWRVDEVIGAKTWMNNSTRNNYKDIQSFKTVASRLVTNYEAQSTLIGGGNFVASPTHGGSVAFRVPVDVTSGNKQIGPVDPIYYNINSNNWQAGNPAKLAIWFYGDPNNTGASMYIKLGNTKITYAGDPGRLLWAGWTRWDVPLTGVNLSSIAEVYYGVDVVGGTGLGQILFDDLTLYRLYPDVPAATKPDAANLIAYYPLNGNANDMKGFGTAYNGTATLGTPAFSTSLATYGQAADCNGTADYIDLGRPADGNVFNPAGDFSVSVWIKPTAWGTGWGHDIVANRGEDPVGWQVRRGASGNRMVFTTRGQGNDDTYSTQNIIANKWTNITCVFDSAKRTKSIYIDGILDAVGATNGNKIARTTAARTYIGCRANGDSATAGRENYFTGLIDEVRLYNSALTAAEALYLANPAPATIVP